MHDAAIDVPALRRASCITSGTDSQGKFICTSVSLIAMALVISKLPHRILNRFETQSALDASQTAIAHEKEKIRGVYC